MQKIHLNKTLSLVGAVGHVLALCACVAIQSGDGLVSTPANIAAATLETKTTASSTIPVSTTVATTATINVTPSLDQTKTSELKLTRKLSGLPRGGFMLSSDNQKIAVFYDGFNVQLLDFQTEKPIWKWSIPEGDRTGTPDWLTSIAYSPNGQYVATGGLTRRLYLLDALTGHLLAKSEPGYSIRKLLFQPNGEKIYAYTEDADSVPVIEAWDVPTAKMSKLPYLGCAFAFTPRSNRLAAFASNPNPGIVMVSLDTGLVSSLRVGAVLTDYAVKT